MYDELLDKLQALDKFNNGKVRIELSFDGSCLTQTYMNFVWDDDAGYLILGDDDSVSEDLMSIDIDNIIDITEINNDLIELEMENGIISIILDTDYSLCFHCREKQPVFYIRAIGETNEEDDIRICQDCFNKIVEMKV
jgi:hypothetical protein